jgi:hypothetical protein
MRQALLILVRLLAEIVLLGLTCGLLSLLMGSSTVARVLVVFFIFVPCVGWRWNVMLQDIARIRVDAPGDNDQPEG